MSQIIQAVTYISNIEDREFLDLLYRTHYKMLHKLAVHIIQEESYAEDVVNNAMLSLFSIIPRLRVMDAAEQIAYLKKTIRNAAYKQFNACKRRKETEIPISDSIFSLPAPDDTEAFILNCEEIRVVRDAIATLPKIDREFLFLKYAAQLTAKEIAAMTHAPSDAAVKERIARARRKVLEILEQQEVE